MRREIREWRGANEFSPFPALLLQIAVLGPVVVFAIRVLVEEVVQEET